MYMMEIQADAEGRQEQFHCGQRHNIVAHEVEIEDPGQRSVAHKVRVNVMSMFADKEVWGTRSMMHMETYFHLTLRGLET